MTLNFISLQAATGGWESILMIVALFAIFYFLMIRPQQKRQKTIEKERAALDRGSKIVTAGGIHGIVRKVYPTSFEVEIAKGICIVVEKTSVYADNSAEPAPAATKEEPADKN